MALPDDLKSHLLVDLIRLLPYSFKFAQRIWPVLDSLRTHVFLNSFSDIWAPDEDSKLDEQFLFGFLIVKFFVSVWAYLAHRVAESTLNSLSQGLFMFARALRECFCQYKIQSEHISTHPVQFLCIQLNIDWQD